MQRFHTEDTKTKLLKKDRMFLMNDVETLYHIFNTYHDMLVEASMLWGGRTPVLAGIMLRETRGGTLPPSSYVSFAESGNPASIMGDGGHGHGLMQIDDRSFPVFTSSEKWRDALENIKFGAYVLHLKTDFFERKKDTLNLLHDWSIERLGIAAYNAGDGRVLQAVINGVNPDIKTTKGDYSRVVLNYAEIYSVFEF